MTDLQCIRFPKADWPLEDLARWLLDHGLRGKKVRKIGKDYHVEINRPSRFDYIHKKAERSMDRQCRYILRTYGKLGVGFH